MIRINLVPIEEREAETGPSLSMPRRSFWIPLTLGIAVLVPLLGMTAMQRIKIAGLRSDIAVAQAEARRLKPQIERIQLIEKDRADLNQRLVTVQGLARDRYLPVQVLDELATNTPEHLWLTKLKQRTTGQVEIEGMTFSNLLVSELMTRMEEADIFDGVALSVAERTSIGEQKVVRFTLNAKIKP